MDGLRALRPQSLASQPSTTSVWCQTEEVELVEAARSSREAFAELYRRNYEAIGRYLHRRTGCAHATEDLLSEVFLSALKALPRYRARGIAFRHWLYRIATRAANHWARKRRKEWIGLDDRRVVEPALDGFEETAGIEIDPLFRPLGQDGEVAKARLFAAGSILANQDWVRQRCGASVAIATAWGAIAAAADSL